MRKLSRNDHLLRCGRRFSGGEEGVEPALRRRALLHASCHTAARAGRVVLPGNVPEATVAGASAGAEEHPPSGRLRNSPHRFLHKMRAQPGTFAKWACE